MKTYGYGIVDKQDEPWWGWGEDCVCEDRDMMDELLETLNDDCYDLSRPSERVEAERRPYRVVRLLFEEQEP